MAGTAIFDMDKTLTRSGTWSRYLFRVNRARPSFYLQLPILGLYAAAYKLGFCSRRVVKERGLRTLRWAQRSHLEQAAAAFADAEVQHGLRRRTRSVLERHRAAGDQLVMATAAADLVARPMADRLGMDLVICTELERYADGRLTGKLAGENCYGLEKRRRLEEADHAQAFSRPLHGYSDHITDRPFLDWVGRGVVVNPDRSFARIAREAGLPIEDWDKDDEGAKGP
ncbi:MAG: HAD-IB family hydrolase [Pseudomonadota bacterium]